MKRDGKIAIIRKLLAGIVLLGAGCRQSVLQDTTKTVLVYEGDARAVIVLPAEPEAAEQQAADELVEHLALISGVTLPAIRTGDDIEDRLPIFIGAAADETIDALILEESDDPWSFALIADREAIHLRGLSPDGTRTAAYELLEQLGVRWFMPGETGRVVPATDTLALDVQRTVQAPSFSYRRGPGRGDANLQWRDRLRMPGVGGRYGSHGISPLSGSRARNYFEEDPRLFALIGGERVRRQLCLTYTTDVIAENRTLQLVADHYREQLRNNPDQRVLNMGPNDGGGFCQCEKCVALDPPESTVPLRTPTPSYTDRYVWFFNQLTDVLSDEFPDVRVGFYAYGGLQMPPIAIEPRDNMAISLAPIHTCRIHGPNNPICPESNFPVWLLENWKPYVGNYIADRGYLFNLACPGFPFSMVHRLREEIPIFYDHGVRIWSADPSSAWASHNPSMYIAAKLLWNHKADVDALLNEFYELYYGPAAEPMAAYHTLMDAAIRDADHHTGSSWDMPNIYPAEIRNRARAYLEQAEELADAADGDQYGIRVEITRVSLDFLDGYCQLMARRYRHDFLGELEALEQIEAIRDRLVGDYEFPMLNARHADRLLSRFIRRMTVANAATLQDGGEIVAPFDHEWQFHIDPERWGQYTGLQKPESEGGNWQRIRTDTSWSNQGLRYYFGQTWYRQEIDVPDTHRGRTIHIWFAGVDSTAEVWLNGQFVGANHGGAEFDLNAYGSSFRAFEFDVTDVIRHGEPNIVTVRAYRPGTAELGTGGLIGPAMFYAPAE